jgi:hypothetical protein
MRIDKRFEKLGTSLSMVVDNYGKLDGEGTLNEYILDAFRLSLKLYQFE